MEWLNHKLDTLDYHLARPEIDTGDYIQKRRLHIGRRLAGSHRVYLDTKQWVQMRDVAMGRPRNRIHSETYERLLSLRSNKKILCPISYSIFVELMTQSDDETRRATARLIDKLAEGYCSVPPHELAERETTYFLAQVRAKGAGLKFNQPPILHTVWNKVAFVYGESIPVLKAIPARLMGAVQRAINDLCWQLSVEELVDMLKDNEDAADSKNHESLARELNEHKTTHWKNNFHELFCDEVRGSLDGFSAVLENAMNQVAFASGVRNAIPQAASKEGGRDLGRLIYSAFFHKKIKRELPQFHIHASLHAAVRFDQARKFQANDFEDFRHACVAIPYYDVFCTERSLRHLVCTNPLSLDKAYGIKVIASDEELLAHMDSLVAA